MMCPFLHWRSWPRSPPRDPASSSTPSSLPRPSLAPLSHSPAIEPALPQHPHPRTVKPAPAVTMHSGRCILRMGTLKCDCIAGSFDPPFLGGSSLEAGRKECHHCGHPFMMHEGFDEWMQTEQQQRQHGNSIRIRKKPNEMCFADPSLAPASSAVYYLRCRLVDGSRY
jgi:hypothetical protein